MPSTATDVGKAKDKYRLFLVKNGAPSELLDKLVNEAALIFAPLSFSEAIRKREPAKWTKAHQKIVGFMEPGQWVKDEDLAILLHTKTDVAGARRRELSNTFGYVLEREEFSPGCWRYRLVDFPSNPDDGC